MNNITKAMAMLSECFAEADTSEEPAVEIKFRDKGDAWRFESYLKHQFEQQYMVVDFTRPNNGIHIHGIKVVVNVQ